MPQQPFADIPKMLEMNAAKISEVLKVPFTAPLAVGSALIETGRTMTRGGQIPTPQMLMQQTAMLMEKASPLALLQKGSEIVGPEKETYPNKDSRTTIF